LPFKLIVGDSIVVCPVAVIFAFTALAIISPVHVILAVLQLAVKLPVVFIVIGVSLASIVIPSSSILINISGSLLDQWAKTIASAKL